MILVKHISVIFALVLKLSHFSADEMYNKTIIEFGFHMISGR